MNVQKIDINEWILQTDIALIKQGKIENEQYDLKEKKIAIYKK